MRMGAPILRPYTTPEEWVRHVLAKGYRAAYSPLRGGESDAEIDRYADAAKAADIVIAEHGAWRCNCISPYETERQQAISFCAEQLAAADRLGARCCVSLSGSRGNRWAAPHADNLSEEIFEMVADNTRKIIDLVKPSRTVYSLEPMPWTFPDSPENYERLIKTVGRTAFGVHYDPVNLIYSPNRYYHSGKYIKEFVKRLGGKIYSCHIKDVKLLDQYVFHLEECIPGEGELDYTTLLTCLSTLNPDLPIMMEHLTEDAQFDQGAAYIRAKANELGLTV